MTLFLVWESENVNGIFECLFLVLSFASDTQKEGVRESKNEDLSRVRERECQWYIRILLSRDLFRERHSEKEREGERK